MSVNFLEEDTKTKWKFAFSIQGKRVIARVGADYLDDELSEKTTEEIIELLHYSIDTNQSDILAEYAERDSVVSNPQYVLTRQGLIHYAH